MRRLIAVIADAGPVHQGTCWFVDVLRRTWDAGDAVAPIDPRLPDAARARLLDALAPDALVGPDGSRVALPRGVGALEGDALVIPTSGSTGTPKGVIHTHASVAASAAATNAGVGADPATDRWLCSLPLAHVAGLSVVTRALASGTALEVHGHFDAEAVTDAARRGATLTTLVPTALARIDPSIFRRIVVGGTAMPPDLPPNAVVSYGLTETGSAVCYDGRPLTGAEVRLSNDQPDDQPDDHPGDGSGEILLRGPMLLRAYRTREPDGMRPLDDDGWFATGDLATADADGSLRLVGRARSVINVSGLKCFPEEIEAVLQQHPDVAAVRVHGRPHPRVGAVPVADVVPRDARRPPAARELAAHCRAALARYKVPVDFRIVDALPLTASGKVKR